MRKTLLSSLSILAATALSVGQALAGTASEMAQKHFAAIGAGDVSALTNHYGEGAVFQWVGGPLDGVYSGTDEISTLWDKFAKAQGALGVDVLSIEESTNDKGTTVNAAVKFMGKNPIPVRYILVYRGDKLVNEVWQIDPNLKASRY